MKFLDLTVVPNSARNIKMFDTFDSEKENTKVGMAHSNLICIDFLLRQKIYQKEKQQWLKRKLNEEKRELGKKKYCQTYLKQK